MPLFAAESIDTSGATGKHAVPDFQREREVLVAIHLTPTELADELHMKRRDVIDKCMQMGVPIFNGRIDRTLFESSLRSLSKQSKSQPSAA
jgi:hypothetical protein